MSRLLLLGVQAAICDFGSIAIGEKFHFPLFPSPPVQLPLCLSGVAGLRFQSQGKLPHPAPTY